MSIRAFYHDLQKDLAKLKKYSQSPASVIDDSPDLTEREQAILKTKDFSLITFTIGHERDYPAGEGGIPPGEGGIPPGPRRP